MYINTETEVSLIKRNVLDTFEINKFIHEKS